MSNKSVNQFNNMFPMASILYYAGAVPIENCGYFDYYGSKFFNQYYVQFNGWNQYPISAIVQNNGALGIFLSQNLIVSNAFDLYKYLLCNGNHNVAMAWKDNQHLLAVLNTQKIAPSININDIIDSTNRRPCYVNLLSNMIYPASRTTRIAKHFSDVCNIPVDTSALLLLGAFSAMTSKRFNCAYQDGKTVAINLYTIAEQPSGTSKTRFQNMTIEPMMKMIRQRTKTLRSDISALEDDLSFAEDGADKKQLPRKIRDKKKELLEIEGLFPITNGTAEALEKTLIDTHGIFSAISSEQGVLNSLLGLSYGKKVQNHDILLNARDGGEVRCSRVGREGYSGYVSGALVCFAQEGTIKKIVQSSNVTGLFERCLVLSEPDLIGSRDHVNSIQPDAELLQEYENQCHFFMDAINKRFDHERLITLSISPSDWALIHHFQNEMEAHLIEGRVYSSNVMCRFISKSRMQIMGLASNLYLLDVNPDEIPRDYGKHYIPSEYVVSAMYMMRQLIESTYYYCVQNGIIDDNEQLKAVYDLFAKKAILSMHAIQVKCEKLKPFKELPSARKVIERIVHYLASNHVLLLVNSSDGGNEYIKNSEPYRYPQTMYF